MKRTFSSLPLQMGKCQLCVNKKSVPCYNKELKRWTLYRCTKDAWIVKTDSSANKPFTPGEHDSSTCNFYESVSEIVRPRNHYIHRHCYVIFILTRKSEFICLFEMQISVLQELQPGPGLTARWLVLPARLQTPKKCDLDIWLACRGREAGGLWLQWGMAHARIRKHTSWSITLMKEAPASSANVIS